MSNSTVGEFLQQNLRLQPLVTNRATAVNALVNASAQLGDGLEAVLYKALVQLDGAVKLEGPAITPRTLTWLSQIADLAINQPSLPTSPQNLAQNLRNFSHAAKRYADFLSEEQTSRSVAPSIVCKNKVQARRWNTEHTPRHTLMRSQGAIYEFLTWMTSEEVNRVERRYAKTEGLGALEVLKQRQRQWAGCRLIENKVTLGAGAFGSAGLTRRVHDDRYLVLKKSHPKPNIPAPVPISIMQGLNDGSVRSLSRVYESFSAYSTRGQSSSTNQSSVYTISELGVVDAQRFLSAFSTLSFALNPEYNDVPEARQLKERLITSDASSVDSLVRLVRLSGHPCSDGEIVRRFKNSMALQILHAVSAMHRAGKAHNDIKPDNLVFAYDENNHLRLKLIDFDMAADISRTVGVSREIYAQVFSAPQVSSSGANNRADWNDAYSLGCTLRLLNGETLMHLLIQRGLVKGEIVDDSGGRVKPVENRSTIEARFVVLPELTTLSDLISLFCHPHAAKRYTVDQALQSPLFQQPNNLLSADQFTQLAEKIIRHSQWANVFSLPDVGAKTLSTLSSALSAQDDLLLLNRYVQQHGKDRLKQKLAKVKELVDQHQKAALVRRGLRALNPLHHIKSAAEQEAGYVFKSMYKPEGANQ